MPVMMKLYKPRENGCAPTVLRAMMEHMTSANSSKGVSRTVSLARQSRLTWCLPAFRVRIKVRVRVRFETEVRIIVKVWVWVGAGAGVGVPGSGAGYT